MFEEVSTTPRLDKEMPPLPFTGCREKMGRAIVRIKASNGIGFSQKLAIWFVAFDINLVESLPTCPNP